MPTRQIPLVGGDTVFVSYEPGGPVRVATRGSCVDGSEVSLSADELSELLTALIVARRGSWSAC